MASHHADPPGALGVEGVLIRAADPVATLARWIGAGATPFDPVADHGWFLGGAVSFHGARIAVSRHGPEGPDRVDALLLITDGGARGPSAMAARLGLAATVPLHSAIAVGAERDPSAWWSVALPGLLDGGPRLPTGSGPVLAALVQTTLGTGFGRRLAARRARGPVVLLRAHETRPLPKPARASVVIATGDQDDAWRRVAAALTGIGAGLRLVAGHPAAILGLDSGDGALRPFT